VPQINVTFHTEPRRILWVMVTMGVLAVIQTVVIVVWMAGKADAVAADASRMLLNSALNA